MSTKREIWLVDFDPTRGSEMRKTRPAVVINNTTLGILPLRIVAPITDWKEHYRHASWMVRLAPTPDNGLQKLSAIDCFQMRSLSTERFIKRLGVIDDAQMLLVTDAVHRLIS